MNNNTVLQRWTWKLFLPWSKHFFTWSLQRRILLWEWRTPSFHQVLRPPAPHLLLWCTSHDPPPPFNREIRTKVATRIRKKSLKSEVEQTPVFKQSVPFCRHNPRAGKRQSEGFSACQRSSVCRSPARMARTRTDKKKKRFSTNHITSSPPSHLKERDFADDGVVDVYGDVQTHFIWQLCQQLLLIWKARKGESAESGVGRA